MKTDNAGVGAWVQEVEQQQMGFYVVVRCAGGKYSRHTLDLKVHLLHRLAYIAERLGVDGVRKTCWKTMQVPHPLTLSKMCLALAHMTNKAACPRNVEWLLPRDRCLRYFGSCPGRGCCGRIPNSYLNSTPPMCDAARFRSVGPQQASLFSNKVLLSNHQ